jgi:hypothetical protein
MLNHSSFLTFRVMWREKGAAELYTYLPLSNVNTEACRASGSVRLVHSYWSGGRHLLSRVMLMMTIRLLSLPLRNLSATTRLTVFRSVEETRASSPVAGSPSRSEPVSTMSARPTVSLFGPYLCPCPYFDPSRYGIVLTSGFTPRSCQVTST